MLIICYRISNCISASFRNYNSFSSFNPFNIFSLEFWQFIGAQSVQPAITQKPPKKYTNQSSSTPANPLNNAHSLKPELKPTKPPRALATSSNRPATTSPKATSARTNSKTISKSTTAFPIDGPIRIALPFLPAQQTYSEHSRISARRSNNSPNSSSLSPLSNLVDKDTRHIAEVIREQHNCPRENEVRFQLFPKICKVDADCEGWQGGELCCEIFGTKSCANGVTKPLEELSHMRK